MNLDIYIKTYLKFPLTNGFVISEYRDYGMAEFCKLNYSILTLNIWRDRIDYYADIVYNEQYFNTTHLANFLSNKTKEYEFINFSLETINVDAEKFLSLLNRILEEEFDIFLEFLFNLKAKNRTKFIEYCEKNKYKI